MIDFEEVKKYLPHYLTDPDKKALLHELKLFPNNLDQRFYTDVLKNENCLFQGDGLDNLIVVQVPRLHAKPMNAMIISNTCDISNDNQRFSSPKVLYAPIMRLRKHYDNLIKAFPDRISNIEDHIRCIRKQLVTSIFFLPKGGRLEEESIVFLDSICNYPVTALDIEPIPEHRIFSLSDYGFYVFLVKLSYHFTRVQEGVERSLTTLFAP